MKEELKKREIQDIKECEELIETYEIKLNLREKTVIAEEDKYDLIDVDDQLLTPDQIKKKRLQKMHKTSSINREERKKKL